MKIALMLAGFLFITLGEHAVSAQYSHWELWSPSYDLLDLQLEVEARRREKEAEAREQRLQKEAEAREKQLEKEAEAREKRLEIDAKRREKHAEAREKQFKVQLDELRQKCAKKGFSNDNDEGSIRQQIITNDIDGFRHIYVQTYSPKTKKISGSYYKINLKDRNAEPICGKLNVES